MKKLIYLSILIVFMFFNDVASHAGTIYYVSPDGNDQFTGIEVNYPLKTIQFALEKAMPGDLVHLLPGVYNQDVVTVRHGTREAPISIDGSRDSIVKGGGKSRIFQIFHDYHVLHGFTIDGLSGAPQHKSSYRDKLLFVQGRQAYDGVDGLRVTNMKFTNAG
jgi:hypothetical protein